MTVNSPTFGVIDAIRSRCRFLPTLMIAVVMTSQAFAEPLNEAIQAESEKNAAAEQAQKQIDQINKQARSMVDEYRQITRQSAILERYNAHLEALVASQQKELDSFERQQSDIEVAQKQVVPLMERMVDSLAQFVELDLPFLADERAKRVKGLKAMMVRADVTDSEKFRRLMEAYQIENEFGSTIESYRANLTLNGKSRPVDFLRLGRVALYYQTLDGSESGVWNAAEKAWQPLSSDDRKPIHDGLQMARKEAAPNLLTLPIPAPEAAQ